MSYEYEVHGHSANTMGKQALQKWLCEMGAKNWRLIGFNPSIESPIIFERKIEINREMRDKQLGKEENDDDGKESETKGD